MTTPGLIASSVFPPAVFAPSQNYGNLVAYPNQQTQYFAQGQSNPPGQTADLILRNLTSILNLLLLTEQTSQFADSGYALYVTKTAIIIQAIINGIIDKFANNPNWFSAILPNKGYASMSSTNSVFGQPNFAPLLQNYNVNNSGLSAQTLARTIYSKLYAQNLDFANADYQINRYTYTFIASAIVTTDDIVGDSITQSVAQWFQYIVNAWHDFSLIYDWVTNTNWYWYSYIQPILDITTVNAVIVEQFIPSNFIVFAPSTSSQSSLSYSADQTFFYVYVFTLLSIVLAKQLRALSLSSAKIAFLKDDSNNTYPFEDVNTYLKTAETAYLEAFGTFISQTNTNDSTLLQGPYLDFSTLTNLNTIAALDPRNCSADPNRSPGSFQPTIRYQIVLVTILIHISSNSVFNTYATSQTPSFTDAYQNFIQQITDVVEPSLNNAYNSLNSRQDIHYGQWPQNMSNI